MPTILLARHAQASYGSADYDVLSERGRVQSLLLAADLVTKRSSSSVETVVSGSLRRQQDTASVAASALKCTVEIDACWNEYDADGVLSAHSAEQETLSPRHGGMSSREFQGVLDRALLAWIEAGSSSPAAETWPSFEDRVGRAFEAVAGGLDAGTTAIVVTSAGVVAGVCASLLGLPPAAFVALNRASVNASLTKVLVGASGRTLVSYNDHAHLERAGRSLVTYR